MVPLSRKNHKMIDGKLLQTDKKYSHLKLKQKEKIAEWMYLETKAYYEKTIHFPGISKSGMLSQKYMIGSPTQTYGFLMEKL